MTDPWDPFPLPTRGDDDERLTFEGIGRALTQWEAVEFQCARLYSIFVGDFDGPTIQQYSEGHGFFQQRLTGLKAKAKNYFVQHPNQESEGNFYCLTSATERFADRRNEVAHGIVFPIHNLEFFKTKFSSDVGDEAQYALIPPYYLVKKHGTDGFPVYAYTSAELLALESRLHTLSDKIGDFRRALIDE